MKVLESSYTGIVIVSVKNSFSLLFCMIKAISSTSAMQTFVVVAKITRLWKNEEFFATMHCCPQRHIKKTKHWNDILVWTLNLNLFSWINEKG